MQTEILTGSNPESIQRAASVLKTGGVVALPTDTVYGIAASVHNEEAIMMLYQVKERASSLAIPVLVGSVHDIEKVSQKIGSMARKYAENFWPGPLTLVLSKNPELPPIISPTDTIGVRQPDHPTALALLKETGPLAVTSANISGAANTHTAQEVFSQLGYLIALILDGGRTPGGIPSTVVDCTGLEPMILRPGPIKMEELLALSNGQR